MAPKVIIIGLITAFIAQELFGWIDHLAKWLVRRNAKCVPSHLRARCEEEWLSNLNDIPGRVTKLLFAIDTFRASNKISHDYFLPNTSYWVPLFIRILDIIFAIISIVILAPVLLAVSAAIKISGKGPIFFRQETVGRYNSKIILQRFRTMHCDSENVKPRNSTKDPRITRIGFILRKLSLDDLPLYINVLKGDMSIVGPRPERPVFIQEFRKNIPKYMLRHTMKAGITGWAQINGWRGNTDIGKRVEHDLYYIENWSLSLDIKILWLTIWKGLVNRNAY